MASSGRRACSVGRPATQESAVVVVSISDFLWFVDHALDEMITIVGQLG